MSGWTNIPENIEEYQGFIYIITSLRDNKYYIGKKNFWRIQKLKPLKGHTRRRLKKVETDWQNYWSSGAYLLEDIEKYGYDSFIRTILKPCKNKWEMSYYEAKLQFERDVLLDERSYNGMINCRIHKRKR